MNVLKQKKIASAGIQINDTFFYIKTCLLLNEQCIFLIIFPLFFQYFYTFFLDQNICLGIHINLLACFFLLF